MKGPESKAHFETEPKLEFRFYFSPHGSAEDLKNLKEALDDADLYIPEAASWNPQTLMIWRMISNGTINADQLDNVFKQINDKERKEFELLYDSKKPIEFIDIPESHPLLEDYRLAFVAQNQSRQLFIEGKFEEALNMRKKMFDYFAEIEQAREKFIEAGLIADLPKLIRQYPKLEEKIKKGDTLKVLLRLGTAHTAVYQDLHKSGENVSRTFSDRINFRLSKDEILKRLRSGHDIGDVSVAKTFIEDKILEALKDITSDSNKKFQIIRKLVGSLDLAKIRKISEEVGGGANFETALNLAGIHIPRSKEELDRFVKT